MSRRSLRFDILFQLGNALHVALVTYHRIHTFVLQLDQIRRDDGRSGFDITVDEGAANA
jgi:hypothetical protein